MCVYKTGRLASSTCNFFYDAKTGLNTRRHYWRRRTLLNRLFFFATRSLPRVSIHLPLPLLSLLFLSTMHVAVSLLSITSYILKTVQQVEITFLHPRSAQRNSREKLFPFHVLRPKCFFVFTHLSNRHTREMSDVSGLIRANSRALLRIRDFNLGNSLCRLLFGSVSWAENQGAPCAPWCTSLPLPIGFSRGHFCPTRRGGPNRRPGPSEEASGSFWYSSPFFFLSFLRASFLRHGRCTPVPLSHRSLLFASGARPGNFDLLPACWYSCWFLQGVFFFRTPFLYLLACREWRKILKRAQFLKNLIRMCVECKNWKSSILDRSR